MQLAGVLAPIPTPIDDRDRVDTSRLRAPVEWWLSSRLTGIVVLGSAGESALLDESESERVIAAVREIVPSGRAFIVGTGRESTQASVRAATRAATLGADAVLVRTPSFFKKQMTSDLFVRHYTAVADASPVPVILYNFPAVTGVNLATDAVSRLAGHPNVIGLKESSGDLAQIADLVRGTPETFAVFCGSGAIFSRALTAGAAGGILTLACVVPDACVRLFELTRQQQDGEATDLQERLTPLAQLLGTLHGVPALKAAMNLMGFDLGVPRPPLVPLGDPAIATLKQELAKLQEVAA
jgi:4-hydroxy-2-oxoglutarate aldolase